MQRLKCPFRHFCSLRIKLFGKLMAAPKKKPQKSRLEAERLQLTGDLPSHPLQKVIHLFASRVSPHLTCHTRPA